MVHWDEMPCVVYDSEVESSHLLLGSRNFTIHLPHTEQSVSELAGVGIENLLDPSHRAGVLDDDIVLPIID